MKSDLKNKITKVNDLLLKEFGVPARSSKLPDPLDLLIATILSQNTNDKNSFKAYTNLKKIFPDWKLIKNTDQTEIEEIIKVAGLGKQKSAAIKNLIVTLSETGLKLSADKLADYSDDEILVLLSSMKGIGLKTASCVLLFALDRNVCPVDTHVHRTLNRLGIVKTSSPDKTFEAVNKNLPAGIAHQFHTNLIRLGREVCKGQKPECGLCTLVEVCAFKDKNFNSAAKRKTNNFLLLDEIGDYQTEREQV